MIGGDVIGGNDEVTAGGGGDNDLFGDSDSIAGGTGAALLFTGLAGRRPDWIDPDDPID